MYFLSFLTFAGHLCHHQQLLLSLWQVFSFMYFWPTVLAWSPQFSGASHFVLGAARYILLLSLSAKGHGINLSIHLLRARLLPIPDAWLWAGQRASLISLGYTLRADLQGQQRLYLFSSIKARWRPKAIRTTGQTWACSCSEPSPGTWEQASDSHFGILCRHSLHIWIQSLHRLHRLQHFTTCFTVRLKPYFVKVNFFFVKNIPCASFRSAGCEIAQHSRWLPKLLAHSSLGSLLD